MSQTAIEEAFHKASNAYWESSVLSETSPDRLKAACSAYAAALSALHAKAGVSVERLEWQDDTPTGLFADTEFGSYGINDAWLERGNEKFEVNLEVKLIGCYPTLEAAKAAAQSDYEARKARIRSALSTKLQEPVGERLATRFANLVSEYRSDTDGPHGEAMREEIEMLVMDNLDTIAAILAHPFAKFGSPDAAIETLLWMRDRDNELGSLPPKYREKIDATLAHQPVTAGWELVPTAAIEWLMGNGPDPSGHHFGEFPDDVHPKGAYWWRSYFRRMIDDARASLKSEGRK